MESVVAIGDALSSSLDLRVVLERAVPLMVDLVSADHVALAVSRPGTLYDYEWYNNSLPQSFLGNYATIADQDFVRAAVARAPNRVLLDQQMIERPRLKRHVVYRSARESGVTLEHVMAVMLWHEAEWSSGLSLYRDREVPYSDEEATLLQLVVPQIRNAVRNCRTHSDVADDVWLRPVMEQAGLCAIWVDEQGAEIGRTAAASAVIERCFRPHERRTAGLPTPLHEHLVKVQARRRELGAAEESARDWVRPEGLRCLRVSFVPLPERRFALVLRTTGLPLEADAKLSPRLREIAAALLQGMTNEEIAARDRRAVATIKQQAGEVCARLGVDGRNGLIRLVAGYDCGEE